MNIPSTTNAPTPRTRAPLATLFAFLSFLAVTLFGGLFIWNQQHEREAISADMIDQLRRIDVRLAKLENAANIQDPAKISEKLAHLDARLTDFASATDTIVSQSNDVKALTEKLQLVLNDQQKLHEEIVQLRADNHDVHAASQQLAITNLKQAVTSGRDFSQELSAVPEAAPLAPLAAGVATPEVLKQELTALAPTLLAPTGKGNFWDSAMQSVRGWVTVRPVASGSADTSTLSGKISRALYELNHGKVAEALDVLPKDDMRLVGFRVHAEKYLLAQQALAKLQAEPAAPADTASGTKP